MFPIRQDLQRKTLEAKERIEKERAEAERAERAALEEKRRLAEAELESKIGSTIACISMKMNEAAEQGKNSVECNFGSQADPRLFKAVVEKFKSFEQIYQKKPFKFFSYENNREKECPNIEVEILTLSW